MEKIKAIIVDDEQGGVANLKYYLDTYCPQIEVVAAETDIDKIRAVLRSDVDVAFLDVEIYQDTIFNLLEEAGEVKFDIVFVTAFEQYALKAFNVDVLDYILKPLKKDTILNCYNKILKRFANTAPAAVSPKNMILRQGDKVHTIAPDDIIYLEANGSYTDIHICKEDKAIMITVSKTLTQIDSEYSYPFLYRVHRSFMINLKKIAEIHKKGTLSVTMSTGDIIPIAKRREAEFLAIT